MKARINVRALLWVSACLPWAVGAQPSDLSGEQQEADYRVIAARCGTPGFERAFYKQSKAAVAELLARQLDRKNDAAPHEQLSEREFQVFLKLATGETAGSIAEHLSLSVKTVSTYRSRLMEKMNLASNSDLTYYALKNQLIS